MTLTRYDFTDNTTGDIVESFYEIDGQPVTQAKAINHALRNDLISVLGPDELRLLGNRDYQTFAVSRLKPDTDDINLLMLGLSSEVGELHSERMRHLRPDRDAIGAEEILSELGDILWYVATIGHKYGFSMKQIENYNRDKLTHRGDKRH